MLSMLTQAVVAKSVRPKVPSRPRRAAPPLYPKVQVFYAVLIMVTANGITSPPHNQISRFPEPRGIFSMRGAF